MVPDSQEVSYYFMNQQPLEESMLNSLYKEDLDKEELNVEAKLTETVFDENQSTKAIYVSP